MLFLIKTKPVLFKNQINQTGGLTYSNITIKELVTKDTDGDGVPDWEEKLWGTDPTKKETTSGISDSVAIAKLKIDQGVNVGTVSQEPENLTQTDKFSRDLFATVAATSQNGESLDPATVDKIGNSLANSIQNPVQKKIYKLSDLKIVNDSGVQVVKNYQSTLGALYKKHTVYVSVYDILAEAIKNGEEGEIDLDTLKKLDPIIEHIKGIIDGMVLMKVPQSLALLHLETINAFEKVMENLNDIKLLETDALQAMGAISQYEKNDDQLKLSIEKLIAEINKKLKS